MSWGERDYSGGFRTGQYQAENEQKILAHLVESKARAIQVDNELVVEFPRIYRRSDYSDLASQRVEQMSKDAYEKYHQARKDGTEPVPEEPAYSVTKSGKFNFFTSKAMSSNMTGVVCSCKNRRVEPTLMHVLSSAPVPCSCKEENEENLRFSGTRSSNPSYNPTYRIRVVI
jgi:hypothetical protein